VKLDDALDESLVATAVGPGHREGHLFRRVDALLGETAELYELLPCAEPELDSRRREAKLVERIDVQPASAGLRR
jgi:hypothetical protein